MVSAEHFLELPQQRSSFLELGRVVGTPYAPTTTNTAEIETQKAEAFAAAEVYISTLLFIDLDLQFGELFAESFLHRHHQPVMSGVGVDQDHQIIGKPCVLDVGVLAVARGLFRPLQHPIHLGEVEVTEERRDHPALRDAALTVGLEHQLQQMQHVRIIHPSCHLGQQTIMSNVVKIAAQVDVYDACLVLNNRSGYPVDRFMSCPLGTISKRSRLEVCLEDRLQYELERTLHHAIPDRGNRKDADFAPVLRYFLPPGR